MRSISELAASLGVNPSTLTRLAKRLGFEGFSDFQSVFRDAIASEPRYFYSRQADHLLELSVAGQHLEVLQTAVGIVMRQQYCDAAGQAAEQCLPQCRAAQNPVHVSPQPEATGASGELLQSLHEPT